MKARKERTLFLPECITDDLVQVVHEVNHHIGVNKYLFIGKKANGFLYTKRYKGLHQKSVFLLVCANKFY
jgi:hypothetical protein